MSWTDEKKAEVIQAYKDAEPTAENSMDIVNELAEQFDEAPNGVRMILIKADAYVKKTPSSTKASSGGGGSKRVSKEEAHSAVSDAISSLGLTPDDDIISKLTGKAALYFAEVIKSVGTED